MSVLSCLVGWQVAVRGMGLLAGYTGRRALFAVYPPRCDGLEVSASGPAPLALEYRHTRRLLLVCYIPTSRGVSLRPPFTLRVEDPPPGYLAHFGAALWHDPPPRPLLLTGMVHFVTEKLYLTKDGRLHHLPAPGLVPQRDRLTAGEASAAPRTAPVQGNTDSTAPPYQTATTNENQILSDTLPVKERSQLETYKAKLDIIEETMEIESRAVRSSKDVDKLEAEKDEMADRTKISTKEYATNQEEIRVLSAKKQVITRIENLLVAANRDQSRKESRHRYKHVSKALIKELSLSLKILNLLGSSQESISPPDSSPECQPKREFVIPEIRITDEEKPRGENGCWEDDRFVGYGARRGGKLGWHWGDDAVGVSAGGVGTVGSGWRQRIWGRGEVAKLLGRAQGPQLTGIYLLHQIYRDQHVGQSAALNNQTILRNNQPHNTGSLKNNPLIRNITSKDITKSSRHISSGTKMSNAMAESRANSLSTSFRSLSLPDFSRMYSLSVRGLRKARSCGDRSFRAVSNSTLSLALKSLFQTEQVYNLAKTSKRNTYKRRKEPVTLVKMSHYGSEHDKRKVQHGAKSVEEWRKYWEEMRIKRSEKEFVKQCSLELTGIVHRGKALFESNSDYDHSEDEKAYNLYSRDISKRSRSIDLTSSPPKIFYGNGVLGFDEPYKTMATPSPVSNKTAFQKAKEMFEGRYNYIESRRKSISERFHVSSLSEDIHHNGVTPAHLGVPNRLSAVSSLGSVYHPDYPHLPITTSRPGRETLHMAHFICQSRPSYV